MNDIMNRLTEAESVVWSVVFNACAQTGEGLASCAKMANGAVADLRKLLDSEAGK